MKDNVQYVGHRYGIVTVFVNSQITQDEQMAIEELLTIDNVLEYDVLVLSKLVELTGKCKVSSKLETRPGKFGTVSGFVTKTTKKSDGIQICALTAGHVEKNIFAVKRIKMSDIEVETKHLEKCWRGDTIDCAAFGINNLIKRDILIDCSFKTPCNTVKHAEVFNWDFVGPDPLDVYIHGAATELGKGTVSCPNLLRKGKSNYDCIMIESEDPQRPFCKQGDSGSMVCRERDRNIEAMAVVIGMHLTYGEVTNKKNDTPMYAALTLDSCLKTFAKDCKAKVDLLNHLDPKM